MEPITKGAEKSAVKETLKLKIGNKELDLTDGPIITGSDRIALKEHGIITVSRGDGMKVFVQFDEDPVKETLFLLHMLKKIDPTVSEAEVNGLSALVRQALAVHVFRATGEVDSPFVRKPSSS